MKAPAGAAGAVDRRPWAGALRTVLPLLALLLAMDAGAPSASAGQETVEVQVPLDASGRLLEITPELRRDLGLFPGIQGFSSARLFRLEDGGHVLEIAYRQDGRTARQRRPLDEAALAAFRADVEAGLAERGRVAGFTREGRGGLVLGQTLLGLGFYGWAVPYVLDLDDVRGPLAAYLLTAGASFYVPYRLTRNASVTYAHRNATFYGGTRGIAHGLGIGRLITGEDGGDGSETEVGVAMATSILGSMLGYQLVDRTGWDQGAVGALGVGGDFGLLAGYGLGYAAGLFEREERFGDLVTIDEFASTREGHAAALAIAGAGLAGGAWMASSGRYTPGDVSALRSVGVLGAQAALPLVDLAGTDDEQVFAAAAVAGAGAGLVLGHRLLRDRSVTRGDGLLINAGHLAGGLTAAGLTYLVDTGANAGREIYLTTTFLGSLAGLALTWRAVDAGAEPSVGGPDARAGPELRLDPAGLLTAVLAPGDGPRATVPLARIRF